MDRTSLFSRFLLLTLIFLLAGCKSVQVPPVSTPPFQPAANPTFTATPVFPLPEGPITFEITPDQKFTGAVTGQGETAILLANMSYGGEAQWDPFIQALDKGKFSIITFNYLRPDYLHATQGISAVLGQLRKTGYKHVICIGASLGVTACGSIGQAPEMAGMVMIAGPNYGPPVKASYPKLFIAAENDPWARDTENAYKAAKEPKQLILIKGTGVHGTELLSSPKKDQFLQALLDFVNRLP